MMTGSKAAAAALARSCGSVLPVAATAAIAAMTDRAYEASIALVCLLMDDSPCGGRFFVLFGPTLRVPVRDLDGFLWCVYE